MPKDPAYLTDAAVSALLLDSSQAARDAAGAADAAGQETAEEDRYSDRVDIYRVVETEDADGVPTERRQLKYSAVPCHIIFGASPAAEVWPRPTARITGGAVRTFQKWNATFGLGRDIVANDWLVKGPNTWEVLDTSAGGTGLDQLYVALTRVGPQKQ